MSWLLSLLAIDCSIIFAESVIWNDELVWNIILGNWLPHDSTETGSFFAKGLGFPKLIQNKRLSADKNPVSAPKV